MNYFDPDSLDIDIGMKSLEAQDGQRKGTQQISSIPFQINMDFLVDPFFKKTSRMFDESSASGLLLNNIAITPSHIISLNSDQSFYEEVKVNNAWMYQKMMRDKDL